MSVRYGFQYSRFQIKKKNDNFLGDEKMKRKVLMSLVVVLSVLLATSISANGTTWQAMDSGTTEHLMDVWGTASDNIFAVGGNGTILHYDGTEWTLMNSPTTELLQSIWGANADDIWIVGFYDEIILRSQNGSEWKKEPNLPSDLIFHDVWGSGPNDVYAVGEYGESSDGGVILHFDGNSWTNEHGPIFGPISGPVQFNGVWGRGPNEVFVVGHNGVSNGVEGVCYRYDGNDWSWEWSGSGWPQTRSLLGVWVTADELFIGGESFGGPSDWHAQALHYNGSAWETEIFPDFDALNCVWGTARDNVYMAGYDGKILHYNGSNCSDMDSGTTEWLGGIWGDGLGNVFAVGGNGTILHLPEPACEWVLLGGELNIPRNALTAEAVNDYLYAIGGIAPPYNVSDAQNAVSKYDPATDTWSLVASMPTARHSLSSAVIGNYIYAVGGHVSNSRSECERYNVLTDTWESLAPKPTAVSGPGIAAFNGKIYAFGGNRYGSMQSVIEVYDPGTNAWSSVGNMPTAGEPWRAVTLGDRIYIGTINVLPTHDQIWCYNPADGTWDTSLPKMNVRRFACELQVVKGRIYVVGGGNPSGTLTSVESWAPGESSWRMEPSTNMARYQFGSGVIGNNIYVFGGNDSFSLASTEVLTICEAPPGTHDECANAIAVEADEPYNGSTRAATGTDTSSCSYNDTNDVWHSFTPKFNYEYTISLCGSSFDTTLSVFDDCNGTELACNDDTKPGICSPTLPTVQSQLTMPLVKDLTYFIRIAGYDGETGDYTLTITGPVCTERPAMDFNDDCKVDFRDLAMFSRSWLDCNLDPPELCWQ